jgi:predicted RNase H-like nuclease (RuvC/YqgF family)
MPFTPCPPPSLPPPGAKNQDLQRDLDHASSRLAELEQGFAEAKSELQTLKHADRDNERLRATVTKLKTDHQVERSRWEEITREFDVKSDTQHREHGRAVQVSLQPA